MSETALSQYDRLESLGLWTAEPGARRENVLVTFGAATLVIADPHEHPLTHWSLAAVVRVNPGVRPAIYAPSAETSEVLEIDDDDMIEALETVRRAVLRRQPKGGRLRRFIAAALVLGAVVGGAIWGPDALVQQAERSLPPAARAEIGAGLLTALQRVGGAPCATPAGTAALGRLAARLPGLAGNRIVVLPQGGERALALPGGTFVIDRRMVEDHDHPGVVAGYLLAADLRAEARSPLADLLKGAGSLATARLLATGHLPEDAFAAHAERLLLRAPAPVDSTALLRRFAEARLSARPYAYAIDITGERTLDLIEADAIGLTDAEPLLRDRDWLALQTICE